MFKAIVLALLAVFAVSQQCDQALLFKCESDIAKAYKYCEAAAQEQGKDQQADIQCVKYFTTMRKECWPCVCEVAKKQGWVVKGCDTKSQ